MKLLRVEDDFLQLKKENCLDDDQSVPEKYPCYAWMVVTSWNYQEELAVFLYEEDIKEMLDDMGV